MIEDCFDPTCEMPMPLAILGPGGEFTREIGVTEMVREGGERAFGLVEAFCMGVGLGIIVVTAMVVFVR